MALDARLGFPDSARAAFTGMSRAPLVSIIVPHYNSTRTLCETVQSVRAQSFADWELIIVDDGSSAEQVAGLGALAGDRITIVEQANLGPAAASQRGIDRAAGRYLAFLDHDDLWLPDKLARDVTLLESHAELDLVFCAFQWIDEHGAAIGSPHRPSGDRFDARLLAEDYCIGPTSTVTMRASAARAAGSMNLELRRYYDFEFFLRVASLRPRNVGATADALTLYRRHAGQLSGDPDLMRAEWARVIDVVRRCPGVDARAVARGQSNMHRYFAFLEYERRHFLTGLGLLGHAFRLAPLYFVSEPRNRLAACGCVAGLLLPDSARETLQQFVTTKPDKVPPRASPASAPRM